MNTDKPIFQHAQINLLSGRRILLFILLVSISPKACTSARTCANARPQYRLYLQPAVTISKRLSHTHPSIHIPFTLEISPTAPLLPPTQGFSPPSRAELKRAVANCARQLPKCDHSIARWDVSNVRRMSGMFQGAESFNTDLSKWQVSKVNNMKNMFQDAASFNRNLCGYTFRFTGATLHMFTPTPLRPYV